MQGVYKGSIQFWISFAEVIVTSACFLRYFPEDFDYSTSYIYESCYQNDGTNTTWQGEGGSYEAVLSLNWKGFWLRTNRNITDSLFKGWVMFCLLYLCKKDEVSWFLMGDLKLEGIGRAYCKYVVKGGSGALAAIVWSWSSAPPRFCGAWRGLIIVHEAVNPKSCSFESSVPVSWAKAVVALLHLFWRTVLCVFTSMKCTMDSSVPRWGRDGSCPGSCHHGLAWSLVEWEQCALSLWTSHRLWPEKIYKDMKCLCKKYDSLQVYREDAKCELCCFLEHIM